MQGEGIADAVVHVAICDDDAGDRTRYGNLIKRLGELHDIEFAVHPYAGGEQLLFAFDEGACLPDVILLDVLMPRLDGIQTARKLRDRGYIGAIVLVSCSDGFVFDAFDIGAFNYVLKGDDDFERFAAVVMAAVAHMERRKRRFILVNGISEHRHIAIDAIRYVESRRHICVIHYNRDAEFELISTLQRMENVLLPYGFVRIHRSYLVSCEYVERYTHQSCALRGGIELPVGRQRYQLLRAAMEAHAVESV